jgi:hypothetical protein
MVPSSPTAHALYESSVVAFAVLFALLMMNTELRSFVVELVYFFGVVLFCAKTIAVVASSRMHTPMAAIFAK